MNWVFARLWELAAARRAFRHASHLVTSHPEILAGEPVFHGTRVPVHLIASLVGQGSSTRDLLTAYPRLTAEMIEAAPLYAAAYPLTERPKGQAWYGGKPVRRSRRKLTTIDAA